MNLLSFFGGGRWLALGLALAALMAGYFVWSKHEQRVGYQRAVTEYTIQINLQKTEAKRVLAVETGKVATITKQLNDFKTNREIQDAKNQVTVSGLERRLVALAGPTRRLRDPHATGCGGGSSGAKGANPASASDSADDIAQAGGLFSAGATELLARLTLKADEINIAFASCRADSLHLREVLK